MASAATAPARAAGVLALADDLSGAAEVAVALRRAVRLQLAGGARGTASVISTSTSASASTVIDLDSRSLAPAEAADRVCAALSAHDAGAGQVLYKKVDSQLRGNLAAEAAAYAEGADGLLIAPALPAAGRTVRDGVVHLYGIPLQHTGGWRAEGRPAPASIAEALAGLPTRLVGLDAVRDGTRALVRALTGALADGRHVIADAETDADLDALARAALAIGPRLRLLGAGGLAGALGRTLPAAALPGRTPDGAGLAPVLAVVGTAEPTAAAQIAHLLRLGARHLPLSSDELLTGAAQLPRHWPDGTLTVLSIAPAGPAGHSPLLAPSAAPRLSRALATLAAGAPGRPDLVLTGGETARRVLDALGITELHPAGEIHHGAVRSHSRDGRTVVTRPGSYGDDHSLLTIARSLRPAGYRPAPD